MIASKRNANDDTEGRKKGRRKRGERKEPRSERERDGDPRENHAVAENAELSEG